MFILFVYFVGSGYQLLVHQVNEWTNKVLNWETLGSDIYIAAQLTVDDVEPSGTVFRVGDGKKYGDYVNKELSNGQKYNIYFRGLSSKTEIKVFFHLEDDRWD